MRIDTSGKPEAGPRLTPTRIVYNRSWDDIRSSSSRKTFVRVQYSVGIHHPLQLFHGVDDGRRPAVMKMISFEESDAVFGTDAASILGNVIVQERLDCFDDPLIEHSAGRVEVQVSCEHEWNSMTEKFIVEQQNRKAEEKIWILKYSWSFHTATCFPYTWKLPYSNLFPLYLETSIQQPVSPILGNFHTSTSIPFTWELPYTILHTCSELPYSNPYFWNLLTSM